MKCVQALDRSPQSQRHLARLATLDCRAGDVNEFIEFCRRHAHKHGRNPEVLVAVGKALLGTGMPEAAQHQGFMYLRSAVQAEPNNAENFYQLGCAVLRREGRNAAAKHHEQALKIQPTHFGALIALGDHHRKCDNYQKAFELYERALHCANGPVARIYYKMGESLVKDGKGDQGRQYLRESIGSDSQKCHFEANLMIALSYLTEERFREALQQCDAATHQQPQHIQKPIGDKLLKIIKGSAYLRCGEYEKCINILNKLSSRNVTDGDAELESHDCELTQNWDEEIDNLLGLVNALQARHRLAHVHFEEAKRKSGATPRPTILANLAYLYQLQGEMDHAESVLQQCLMIAPRFPMALLRIGYLLLCRREWEGAVQYLQKCIEQPCGTLMFGTSNYGAAQLYLCIAHHFLQSGDFNHTHQEPMNHFRSGKSARKDLRDLEEMTPEELSTREPFPRGSLDLNKSQARVVLLYARANEGLNYESDSDSENHNNQAINYSSIGTVLHANSAQHAIGENLEHPKVSSAMLTESASTNASTESTSCTDSRETCNSDLHAACSGSFGESSAVVSGMPSLADLEARISHTQRVRLADLEMIRCLASGAFGTVYYGKYFCNDREVDVVVKRLHVKDGKYDGQTAEELQAEIAILSLLSHPRLVRFVGACLKPPDIACVTEYAAGGNLHNAIHVMSHPFKREVRFQLSIDLLEGIHYMHSRSPPVAHFDIKTLNLVLDVAMQRLQVCDFGLARVIGGDTSRDPLRRGGSPRYMAPECLEGSATPLTERADVWSCGCVLLELFGEVLPYAECANAQQIMKMMLVQQQGPTIGAGIEVGVKDIVAGMLSFNPLERGSVESALQRVHTLHAGFDSRTEVQQSHQTHPSRFLWMP